VPAQAFPLAAEFLFPKELVTIFGPGLIPLEKVYVLITTGNSSSRTL
jgi:hypothetical protein